MTVGVCTTRKWNATIDSGPLLRTYNSGAMASARAIHFDRLSRRLTSRMQIEMQAAAYSAPTIPQAMLAAVGISSWLIPALLTWSAGSLGCSTRDFSPQDAAEGTSNGKSLPSVASLNHRLMAATPGGVTTRLLQQSSFLKLIWRIGQLPLWLLTGLDLYLQRSLEIPRPFGQHFEFVQPLRQLLHRDDARGVAYCRPRMIDDHLMRAHPRMQIGTDDDRELLPPVVIPSGLTTSRKHQIRRRIRDGRRVHIFGTG